jgi:hypothetical protein
MGTGAIPRVPAAAKGRMRAFACALLYTALAFWLFSSDWLLRPVLRPLGRALHVGGLDAGTVAFYETINLVTALLLTGLFA